MEKSTINKVPYIAITADTYHDEYNNFKIGSWDIQEASQWNILGRNSGISKTKHGLNFNTNKWTPQMKDKIYFMKGCTVPRVKLKDLSVKYKIRTTTDIDSATVVVGSDRAGSKLFKETWVYKVYSEVFEACIKALDEVSENKLDSYYTNWITNLKESFNDEWPEYIYCDWATQRICNPLNDSYTPELNKALLKILNVDDEEFLKKYPKSVYNRGSEWVQTISEDNLELYEKVKNHNVIEQSALLEVVNGSDATTVDLDTYQNLRNMFNSSDQDNHVMAMEIMANCNYKDSMLYLLMLFFHHDYQINATRTKNHVNFKSLKNYLNISGGFHQHVDSVISRLIDHNCLTQKNLDFIVNDQRDFFERNGSSGYIVPQAYVLKREVAEANGMNYKKEIFEYIDDLPTEDEVTEEKVVEDTVKEVTPSEAVTALKGAPHDPETEEAEVETEEEVTETLIAEQKEEKNEEEFDWF